MTAVQPGTSTIARVIGVFVVSLSVTAWSGIASAAPEAEAEEGAHSEHGAASGDHAQSHGSPNPLDFKQDLAIWTFVVFLVLFGVLRKFAWKPISEALDQREQGIADNIAAARRTHEEAKQLLVDYERKLAGAADQVRELLDEARRDAEHTKQEIINEARQGALAEQERAVREIRTATDVALKELSEKSTDLAIDLAGKVISAKLTPQERSHLVQDALNKFASVTPSAN